MSLDKFLDIEEAKIFEMARAWKKKGLEGPYKLESGEMGGMLDVLAQYVVEDGQLPTHYIHFGQIEEPAVEPVYTKKKDPGAVGITSTPKPDPKLGPAKYVGATGRQSKHGPQFKFGVHPGSKEKFNTPIGIYAYPLTRRIFDTLKETPGRGLVTYAAQSSYVLLFKPKEGLPIIYSSQDLPQDEYKEYVKRLFSEEFIDKQHKINKALIKKRETWADKASDEDLDSAADGKVRFLRDGKKETDGLENGKWLWGAHMQNAVVDKAIEIYKEKEKDEQKVKDFIAAVDRTKRPPRHVTDVGAAYGGANESVEWKMYSAAEKVIFDGILKPMFTQYPFGQVDEEILTNTRDEADHGYAPTYEAPPSWRHQYTKPAAGRPRRSREMYYNFMFEMAYVGQPGGKAFVEAAQEIINSQEGQDRWFDDEDTDWAPSDNYKVKEAEAGSREYLQDVRSVLGDGVPTTVGYLWNLARLAANEDPMRWNAILRELGIGGFVDDAGTSFIHQAEPVQAVFFSKRDPDANLILLHVMPNEMTPEKHKERRDWSPRIEFRKLVTDIMKNIYPEYKITDSWFEHLMHTDELLNLLHSTAGEWTTQRRLDAFKSGDPLSTVYSHATSYYANGAQERIKGLNEDFEFFVMDNSSHPDNTGRGHYRQYLKPGDQMYGKAEQPWLNFLDGEPIKRINVQPYDHDSWVKEIEAFNQFSKDAQMDVKSLANFKSDYFDRLRRDFVTPTKHIRVQQIREDVEKKLTGENDPYLPESNKVELIVMERIREEFKLEREWIDREYVQKYKGIRDKAADHVRNSWERWGPEVVKAAKKDREIASEFEARGNVAQQGFIDAPPEDADDWKPGMPTPKNEVKHLHLNYLNSKWDWLVE